MDWEVSIGLFMLLGGLSAIIDSLLKKESIRKTQTLVADWQKQLIDTNFVKLIKDSNKYINKIFNAFYGERHLSIKTFIRSTITSIFAVSLCMLVLKIAGYKIYNTYFDKQTIPLTMIIIFFNIIADYFSLIETRVLLKKSEDKSIIILFLFLILDLLFTFLCYGLLVAIFVCFIFFFFFDLGFFLSDFIENFKVFLDASINPEDGGPYVWSTFFTSFLFHLFIANALLIKLLHLIKAPVTKILEYYSTAKNPVKSMVAILAACVLILEGLKRLFM